MSRTSPFVSVPQAPPDPILGLTEAFQADTNPHKVNLGVGVYQDGNGRVPILRAVAKAQERWIRAEDTKTYLPIDGLRSYNTEVQRLILGDAGGAVESGRAVTLQTLGGTGALRIGAEFLARFHSGRPVYLSAPSWENHRAIFEAAGHDVRQYAYYDPAAHGLDYAAMLADLEAAPEGSVALLHACCHNPTGVDPSLEQWRDLLGVCQSRGLFPFFDFAYQGLGSGLDEDAAPVRMFVEQGQPCLIANSFSKSLSLYRERVGGLTAVTGSSDEAARALSQLKRVVRVNVSNPPSFGAQVASIVLSDPDLSAEWRSELEGMRLRIWRMRERFAEALKERNAPRDFSFIRRQKGMFSFLGLSVEAVHRLRSEFSIYAVDSSRVCVAAMNEGNLERICDAVLAVL